jgi:proton-dependent oligopeptide transporter, POT family
MSAQKHELFGHPRGLTLLFFTEMWERFSYYGMRAIFTLYMINALQFSRAKASEIYGSYTGLVYLTPLIGGYVADRYWGNRKSIVRGGISMAIGQLFMFGSASVYNNIGLAVPLMWAGLISMILGNGFFKPNISSMIGQLYSEGDKRRDAAYTIFYMGINLGAFLSPLVCGYLGERYDTMDKPLPEYFKWGFLAAGIGMMIGTALFYTQKEKYVTTPDGQPIGALPNKSIPDSGASMAAQASEAAASSRQLSIAVGLFIASLLALWKLLGFDFIGAMIYSGAIAISVMIITDPSLTKIERDRTIVIYVSAFFVVFFWAAFEQAGASLTFFAEEQTNRNLMGYTIPASFFQSVNAVAVVLLAPLIAALWLALAKRNAEPNSLRKQAFGLVSLALGYVVIAIGVDGVGLGMKVSMFWLIALYVLHTIGELCLSPIGLSLVSKLAPMRFVSLLFGVWFLANAVANKAAGQLSGLYPPAGREYKMAMENGIDNDTYRGILEGQIEATPEQASIAKDKGIPLVYPKFMGFQLKNLYHFFTLFVIMSGIAGAVLFLLSFPFKRMMHGAD